MRSSIGQRAHYPTHVCVRGETLDPGPWQLQKAKFSAAAGGGASGVAEVHVVDSISLVVECPTMMMMRPATSIAQSLLRRSTALRVTRGYHAPMREMKFLLYEVHDFPQHYADIAAGHGDVDESSAHQPCDKDTVEMVLESTQQLCEKELSPLLSVADKEGCTWVSPTHIKAPPGFKEAYQLYAESGWQGLSFPPQYGGQGLPMSLGLIQSEMCATANYTWTMFPGLSKGAINTILAHGADKPVRHVCMCDMCMCDMCTRSRRSSRGHAPPIPTLARTRLQVRTSSRTSTCPRSSVESTRAPCA